VLFGPRAEILLFPSPPRQDFSSPHFPPALPSPIMPRNTALAHTSTGLDHYQHADWLGSVRLTSSPSRSYTGSIAYAPFGETWYSPSGAPWMFSTYYRDTESTNDYALARSYVNRLARFSSVDPLSGYTTYPQSLNKYSFVMNDPINLADPTGMGPHSCTGAQRRDNDCGHQINDAVGSMFNCDPLGQSCGGNCIVNGFAASCGFALNLIQMGITTSSSSGSGSTFQVWTPGDCVSATDSSGQGSSSCETGNWSTITIGGWSTTVFGSSGTVMPTTKVTFRPPSWSNFAEDFLPCYGSQLLSNFLVGKSAVGTVATVALFVTKPWAGVPALAVWTGINAPKAGMACAYASRTVYQ
jgi:RHS repeat-associated protein